MVKTSLMFSAYSDDNIVLEVFEDEASTFENEFGTSKKTFRVEGICNVTYEHTQKDGWQMAISMLEDLDPKYINVLYYLRRDVNGYSPSLKITIEGAPVVVTGIYGGKKTRFVSLLKDLVRSNHDLEDDETLQKLYDTLVQQKLIKE